MYRHKEAPKLASVLLSWMNEDEMQSLEWEKMCVCGGLSHTLEIQAHPILRAKQI